MAIYVPPENNTASPAVSDKREEAANEQNTPEPCHFNAGLYGLKNKQFAEESAQRWQAGSGYCTDKEQHTQEGSMAHFGCGYNFVRRCASLARHQFGH